MACDFKPGDEVVCVDAKAQLGWPPTPLTEGECYVVAAIEFVEDGKLTGRFPPGAALVLEGVSRSRTGHGWSAARFRKVQRRKTDLSIEAFLTIKPGFEEPRRPKAPAKRECV